MQQDERIAAFRRAIRKTIRSDDRVLDLGTGLGTYALFAADAGAAKVWAVEGNPVVHVAETIARLNGYAERVEFVRGWIPDVSLPEPAGVLIFEDFPARLMDARVYRLFRQLCTVYLTHDVRVVPARACQYLAPVTAVDVVPHLGRADDTAYGINWVASREYLVNTPQHTAVTPEWLAGPPARVSEIDLAADPVTWSLGGEARWTVDGEESVTGLAYWFDLDLCSGECLSNAPGASPASWGQLLLPLDPPLRVAAGGELHAAVRPDPFSDGAPGWLRWSAVARDERREGHEFAAQPLSFADLYAQSSDAMPRLSRRGRLHAEVLRLTDGKRTVGEIAVEIRRLAPGLSPAGAQSLVVEALSGKLESATLENL